MIIFILILCLFNFAASAILLYTKLKTKPLSITNKTEELSDFIADLKLHGYGVVRLDPDSLLYRSPRTR